MNRQRAKELLPIIEHFANGGDVQSQCGMSWVTLKTPVWCDMEQYRIKPEPMECWVNEYPSGIGDVVCKSIIHARETAGTSAVRVAVHMREVEE